VGDDKVSVKVQVLAEYRDGRLELVATTRDPSLLWVSAWHASQDKPGGERAETYLATQTSVNGSHWTSSTWPPPPNDIGFPRSITPPIRPGYPRPCAGCLLNISEEGGPDDRDKVTTG
jgi:hypothetical protein